MSNFPEDLPVSLSRFTVASDSNLPAEDANEVGISSAPPEAPLGDAIPISPTSADAQEISPQSAEEGDSKGEVQPRDLLPSLRGTRILVYSLPFRSQRSSDEDWVPNPGLAPSENSAQMIRQFKRWGYEIDWVTQQQKCLEHCDKKLPSALILISSILTPDLLETCQTLVPRLGEAGPPLIVLAPFRSAPHLLNPILGTGIAEYLPHPMEADLLVQRVDRLIHLYQSTIEMRQQYSRERQLIDRLIETNALLARTQEK
ncbi:MAG: hypothetical protein AAGA67_13720, partial [Cyanobacteria bacterium P01_F01_bin.153]